jgi:hypothetical protein
VRGPNSDGAARPISGNVGHTALNSGAGLHDYVGAKATFVKNEPQVWMIIDEGVAIINRVLKVLRPEISVIVRMYSNTKFLIMRNVYCSRPARRIRTTLSGSETAAAYEARHDRAHNELRTHNNSLSQQGFWPEASNALPSFGVRLERSHEFAFCRPGPSPCQVRCRRGWTDPISFDKEDSMLCAPQLKSVESFRPTQENDRAVMRPKRRGMLCSGHSPSMRSFAGQFHESQFTSDRH